MKRIAIAAATVLAMLGTSAQAQTPSPLYGEVGYYFLKIKAEGESISLGALRGILGYDLHPNSAVEGMLAFGVRDEKESVVVNGMTVSSKLGVQSAFGIYVKP